MGRVISPVTRDEKTRLWESSMDHATRPDGSVNWVVFKQDYFGYTIIGDLSSSSGSDSDSSDSDCVFLYATSGSDHMKEVCHYILLEQNVFNIATLSFNDNKVLKVQLDMLIFVQVWRTID